MKKLISTLLVATVALGIAAVAGPAHNRKPISHTSLCCDPPPICPPVCDPPPPGGGQRR